LSNISATAFSDALGFSVITGRAVSVPVACNRGPGRAIPAARSPQVFPVRPQIWCSSFHGPAKRSQAINCVTPVCSARARCSSGGHAAAAVFSWNASSSRLPSALRSISSGFFLRFWSRSPSGTAAHRVPFPQRWQRPCQINGPHELDLHLGSTLPPSRPLPGHDPKTASRAAAPALRMSSMSRDEFGKPFIVPSAPHAPLGIGFNQVHGFPGNRFSGMRMAALQSPFLSKALEQSTYARAADIDPPTLEGLSTPIHLSHEHLNVIHRRLCARKRQ